LYKNRVQEKIMASILITGNNSLPILKTNTASKVFGITIFAALTILGAKFEIPTQPVPFTLQTLFVLLSGAFLGKKDGAICQILYLLVGAAGVPVFAGPIAGFMKLLGPTGGYLIAFPIAAYFTGLLMEQKGGILRSFISMFVGFFIIFTLGIFHLNIFYVHDINASLMSGLVIFSVWEFVKIVSAAMITGTIKR
jgi:biotin transport system substrate-specific component